MSGDGSDDEETPMAVALDAGGAQEELPGPLLPPPEPGSVGTPVPVTLITGYLGAGKTTLVHHILSERHGYRVAVILNEYGGEPGLEAAFVQDDKGGRASVPQWVELANGCLCCSVKAEFVQALEGLLAAGSAHAGKFDYVLVETTGLANPGPIMAELWTDEELEAAVVLDGVVAVVDARNVRRQLAEPRPGGGANEAQLQVALADVVLLNKMDLVSQDEARDVQAALRAINSAADIVPTCRSRVDLAQLLNRGAYRMRLMEQQEQLQAAAEAEGKQGGAAAAAAAALSHPLQWLAGAGEGAGEGAARCAPGCSDPEHGHKHGAEPCAAHDAAVRTVALRASRPLLLDRVREWVERMVWDPQPAGHSAAAGAAGAASASGSPAAAAAAHKAAEAAGGVAASPAPPSRPEVLRMKGLLDVAGSGRVHVLQSVYDLYDIAPGGPWDGLAQGPGAAAAGAAGRASRLVLIGRGLDRARLQEQLEACCAG